MNNVLDTLAATPGTHPRDTLITRMSLQRSFDACLASFEHTAVMRSLTHGSGLTQQGSVHMGRVARETGLTQPRVQAILKEFQIIISQFEGDSMQQLKVVTGRDVATVEQNAAVCSALAEGFIPVFFTTTPGFERWVIVFRRENSTLQGNARKRATVKD